MNFFNGIYTLQEIGIHHNFSDNQIKSLSKLSNEMQLEKIIDKFPELKKFIPYCELYENDNKKFYAIPAYIYDTYINTGFLIDIDLYDKQSDVNKKEYWQYTTPLSLDIKPQEDWEFCKDIFKNLENDDVWKLFLSGNARMNYYQNENTKIEQRIKYAIVEYMLKRPQFFTTDDFYDNPILHKKYSKD